MKITEHKLIRAIKKRDEKALEYILDQYGGLYKAIIAKTLRGMPQYQEECLSDVILKIWQKYEAFQPEKGSFKNWSCALARYIAIDYLRKYQEEGKNMPLDKVLEGHSFEENPLWYRELDELLGALSEEERYLFIELFLQGKSVGEMAEQLQVKPEVIYNRVSRGRKKLRAEVQREEGI